MSVSLCSAFCDRFVGGRPHALELPGRSEVTTNGLRGSPDLALAEQGTESAAESLSLSLSLPLPRQPLSDLHGRCEDWLD